MTPYFLPPRELVAALQAASLRGIEVTLVLPEKNNLPFVHWANRNMLWELLYQDIEVVYQPPPFAHTKLFADRRRLRPDRLFELGFAIAPAQFRTAGRSVRRGPELATAMGAPIRRGSGARAGALRWRKSMAAACRSGCAIPLLAVFALPLTRGPEHAVIDTPMTLLMIGLSFSRHSLTLHRRPTDPGSTGHPFRRMAVQAACTRSSRYASGWS